MKDAPPKQAVGICSICRSSCGNLHPKSSGTGSHCLKVSACQTCHTALPECSELGVVHVTPVMAGGGEQDSCQRALQRGIAFTGRLQLCVDIGREASQEERPLGVAPRHSLQFNDQAEARGSEEDWALAIDQADRVPWPVLLLLPPSTLTEGVDRSWLLCTAAREDGDELVSQKL